MSARSRKSAQPPVRVSERDLKERLKAAALACFVELGLEKTTIRKIHVRAGTTNGSAYHAFPGGKAALVELTYEALNSDLRATLDAAAAAQPANAPALKLVRDGLLKPYIGWCKGHRGETAFMFQVEANTRTPKFKMLVNVARDELRKLLMATAERRFRGLRQHLPMSYIESLVLGPVKLVVADAVRGAIDFGEFEKRASKFAAVLVLSLKEFSGNEDDHEDD